MENYDIHFRWMRAGILYSEVKANSKTREVEVVNFTDEREEKVFGQRENPTWDDLVRFVESRCIPPTRHNIRDLLDMVGLPKYDAFALFQITSGHFAKDKCYAEIVRWIYD